MRLSPLHCTSQYNLDLAQCTQIVACTKPFSMTAPLLFCCEAEGALSTSDSVHSISTISPMWVCSFGLVACLYWQLPLPFWREPLDLLLSLCPTLLFPGPVPLFQYQQCLISAGWFIRGRGVERHRGKNQRNNFEGRCRSPPAHRRQKNKTEKVNKAKQTIGNVLLKGT